MANGVMLAQDEGTLSRTRMHEDIPTNSVGLREEKDRCVVLCEKLMPNVFFIKSGLLIIDENEGFATPESRSVTCLTKIIFIPE